jgi:hypothetical protein
MECRSPELASVMEAITQAQAVVKATSVFYPPLYPI